MNWFLVRGDVCAVVLPDLITSYGDELLLTAVVVPDLIASYGDELL